MSDMEFIYVCALFIISLTCLIYFCARISAKFKEMGVLNDLKSEINEKKIMEEIHQMEIRLSNQINRSFNQLNEAQWQLKEEVILLEHKSSIKPTIIEPRRRGRPPKTI